MYKEAMLNLFTVITRNKDYLIVEELFNTKNNLLIKQLLREINLIYYKGNIEEKNNIADKVLIAYTGHHINKDGFSACKTDSVFITVYKPEHHISRYEDFYYYRPFSFSVEQLKYNFENLFNPNKIENPNYILYYGNRNGDICELTTFDEQIKMYKFCWLFTQDWYIFIEIPNQHDHLKIEYINYSNSRYNHIKPQLLSGLFTFNTITPYAKSLLNRIFLSHRELFKEAIESFSYYLSIKLKDITQCSPELLLKYPIKEPNIVNFSEFIDFVYHFFKKQEQNKGELISYLEKYDISTIISKK